MKAEIDRLVKLSILTKVYSVTWASPIVTECKKNGNFRICADFSATVNRYLDTINAPLVTIDEAIASVGNANVLI